MDEHRLNPAPPAAAGSARNHIPGEAGLWVFIFGDLLLFLLFFCTYLVYRSRNLTLYVHSQAEMQRGFGLFNTLALLASSWLVALAVTDARRGPSARTRCLLAGALAGGLGFLASKVLEWGGKLRAGISLNTNEFYTFYYMFTGIHLMHLLIGLAVLTYMLARTGQSEQGPAYLMMMEAGGAFWHLVDLLWVILFALLYLLR
jgi:nitric oxide reductase NorE protein